MAPLKIDIRPGDIFCSKNPEGLGPVINFVQRLTSVDRASEFGHAGVILNAEGKTFEARWRVGKYSLRDYVGVRVLIGRNRQMTTKRFIAGWKSISHLDGTVYPFWRLALFILPPFMRPNWTGRGVCSEVDDFFLGGTGIVDPATGKPYAFAGRNPDNLADMIRRWGGPGGWSVIMDDIFFSWD